MDSTFVSPKSPTYSDTSLNSLHNSPMMASSVFLHDIEEEEDDAENNKSSQADDSSSSKDTPNSYLSYMLPNGTTIDNLIEPDEMIKNDLFASKNLIQATTVAFDNSYTNDEILENVNMNDNEVDFDDDLEKGSVQISIEHTSLIRSIINSSKESQVSSEVGEKVSNSKDELNLLPPLPKSTDAGFIQQLESSDLANHSISNRSRNNDLESSNISFNDASHKTSNGPADQLVETPLHATRDESYMPNRDTSEVEMTEGKDDDLLINTDIGETSFDLSKALKIPVNDSTSQHTNNFEQGNNGPFSPILSSPKLSLKKKISNVLLSNEHSFSSGNQTVSMNMGTDNFSNLPHDSSHIYHPKNSNRTLSNGIPGKNSRSNSYTQSMAFGKLEGHSTSSSSSNNNIRLPSQEINRSSASTPHDNQTYTLRDKKLMKKMSYGSVSSNSTNSSASSSPNHGLDKDLFKNPKLSLNYHSDVRSRSSSNATKFNPNPFALDGIGIQLGTPMSSSNQNNTNTVPSKYSSVAPDKKMPLLKRASSALLRKMSMPSTKNQYQFDNSSSGLVSSNTSIMSEHFPNNLKSSSDQHADIMSYVTRISSNTDIAGDKPISRNSSVGSKVKRSFSRIISGSGESVRRVVSTSNLKTSTYDEPPATVKKVDIIGKPRSIRSHTMISDKPNYVTERNTKAIDTQSKTVLKSNSPKIVFDDVESMNFVLPTQSSDVSHATQASKEPSLNEITTLHDSHELSKKPGFEEILKVDDTLQKITKAVPIISLTDEYNPKYSGQIRVQSNVCFDAPLNEKDATSLNVLNLDNESLKGYINVLIKQQRIEDERLARLEKELNSSGWCSNYDLALLKKKRLAVNNKWAERISFYQNRLD